MASKAQPYIDGFIARGFSPVQAAVLAGNFAQESGFNTDAYNPKEDAYGGIQWRLDRKTGLEQYAKDTGRKVNDPDLQMDYVVTEMTGNEAANAAEFLAAQDPLTANKSLKKFIRYGDNSENARLNNALSYMGQPSTGGGNALMAGNAPAGGGNPLFVNPSFGGAEMPAPAAWPSAPPVAAPAMEAPANDDALLNQFEAPTAQPAGQSDDDLLNSFMPGAPAPASAGGDAADEDLLKSFMPASTDGAETAAKPDGEQPVERNDLNRLLFGGDRAPSNIMELITGTGEKKDELGGYAGDVAKRLEANPENGYEPSSVPWLDPVSTFANAAIDAVPVVGPALTGLANQLDAATASALEGKTVTPEERAAINAAQAKQFGELNTAGEIAGTVGPFLGLGATGVGGRLLGVTGSLPSRVFMGGASNALIAGGDTLARGGDMRQAGQNALMGGIVGGAVPAAMGLAGKAGNALLGKVSPEIAQLAETARTKYGIPLGAGQISENPMIRFTDDVVNKLPFSGGTLSAGEQQTALNREVAKLMGESAEKLSPDVMAKAKTRLGQTFDDVAAKTGTIPADPTFDQSMLNVMTEAQSVLTPDELKPLMNQFDQIMAKFKDGGNAIDGDVYQSLTHKDAPLDILGKRTNIGVYARRMRDALDDALERAAPPNVRDDLLKARSQYKVMKTVEGLAEKGVVGDINPALLLGAVRSSYDNVAYGAGGDLAELARIGQAFMKKPPSSGTAERALVMNMLAKAAPLASIGGASSAAMGIGSLPLTVAAGAASIPAYLAAAKGLGALMRSDTVANKLIANSLGRAPKGAQASALNLLLRGASGAGGLEQGRKPIEITVTGGNRLLAQ